MLRGVCNGIVSSKHEVALQAVFNILETGYVCHFYGFTLKDKF